MQWLLHGNLTPAVADALVRHGHRVHTAAELGDAPLPPHDLLKQAQQRQWDILTADASLAAAPFDLALRFNGVIVYLQLEGGDVEQDDAIDRLFARYKRLTPHRLYTVTEKRVKVRQLPQG